MELQKLPEEYDLSLKRINNIHIKKIYAQFELLYFSINNQQHCIKEKEVKECFLNLLKDIRLISYKKSNNSPIFQNNENFSNYILCCEGKCLILEGIDSINIEHILKEMNISLVDTNSVNVAKEISSFYNYFSKNIGDNEFVKYTISPIIGFIIRRFFYPTHYFNDSSFFNFHMKDNNSFKNKFKNAFNKLLTTKAVDEINYININEIFTEIESEMNKSSQKMLEFNEFKCDEFIILRDINIKEASFLLVIHIDSLHVFMMKKFQQNQTILSNNNQQREISFCQNYSHPCFTPFYGFVKENSQIIGLIYEFMSNDSLHSYAQKDEIFSFLTLIRISQGIQYIHSNSLIHRDLKPMNILINHDGMAFISDFETIRSDNGTEKTNDIGSLLYISPEQYEGRNYSFPTDVYSFGLIIYFLYEHKNQKNQQIYEKKESFPKISNCPEIIEFIYESCIKYNPEKRNTIEKINDIIYNEIILLKSFNNFCIQKIDKNLIAQYVYENICFMMKYQQIEEIKKYFYNIYDIIISKMIKIKEYYLDALNYLGNIYFHGMGRKRNYIKAKENYEISAKFGNSWGQYNLGYIYSRGYGGILDFKLAMELFKKSAKQNNSFAQNGIGFLYKFGRGVKRNFGKAFKYFKLSAEQNNSNALYNLGYLYLNGYGVEKDIFKAKEYLEMSANLNNSFAFNDLGKMYELYKEIHINFAQSKIYYEKGVELNNSYSMVGLASLYINGNGVTKDILEAQKLLERASKMNNPRAFMLMGKIYFKGICVKQDYKKAKEYFESAAEYEQMDALYYLGEIYFYGLEVEKNYTLAKIIMKCHHCKKNQNLFIC